MFFNIYNSRLIRILTVLTAILPAVTETSAQNEASHWCFGIHAHISFASGTPVAVGTSAMNTREGCCTISDAEGNLLFYSDGVSVWNRNHNRMPNGFALLGNSSSTQSSIVIPKPGSSHLYYLFTVPDCNQAGGLCYSLVDMTLDGGMGDIVVAEKNITLLPNVTEKVTAILHANQTDIWVITHERNNNTFAAFLVGTAGINHLPVKSYTGSVHGPHSNAFLGYMKASPDGNRLAVAVYSPLSFFELFDFNNSNGTISNPVKFTNGLNGPYGVEFSPNSQLLYLGDFNLGKLYQANLSGDSAAIVASMTQIAFPLFSMGALQIGSDQKIYITVESHTHLHVISNPNVAGAGCGYQANAVFLGGNTAKLGLPSFIQSYFNPLPFTYKYVCFGDTTEFTPEQTTGYDSLLWNFGDPASAPFDTSGLTNPTHIFTAPGTYTVSLTTWSGGNSAVMTQEVKINPLPQPNLGADTTLCGGSALVLALGETYTEYLWSDGSTGKTLIVTTTGTYTVTVTDGNGCHGSDGIHVEFHTVPSPVLIRHDE